MKFDVNTHHSNFYLFLTVRIAGTTSDGVGVCGTGFYYELRHRGVINDIDSLLIVTNKHVVKDIVEGQLLLHLHAENDPHQPALKSVLLKLPNFQKYWIPHPDPDVDLCAAPVKQMISDTGVDGSRLYSTFFNADGVGSDAELQLLPAIENIVMIGYPQGLWDEANNLPLIRKGVTATHPAIDYEGKATGLVDIATFEGSSGSPLIVYNDGVTLRASHPSTAVRSKTMFLGVISHSFTYTEAGEIIVAAIPTKMQQVAITQLGMHLGIYCKSREVLVLAKVVAKALGIQLP